MNYRMIKYTLGWVMLFEACFFTVPIICAAVYREKEIFAFLISAAICAAGALCLFIGKPKSRDLYAREGYIIVAMCWIFLSLFVV